MNRSIIFIIVLGVGLYSLYENDYFFPYILDYKHSRQSIQGEFQPYPGNTFNNRTYSGGKSLQDCINWAEKMAKRFDDPTFEFASFKCFTRTEEGNTRVLHYFP